MEIETMWCGFHKWQPTGEEKKITLNHIKYSYSPNKLKSKQIKSHVQTTHIERILSPSRIYIETHAFVPRLSLYHVALQSIYTKAVRKKTQQKSYIAIYIPCKRSIHPSIGCSNSLFMRLFSQSEEKTQTTR